MYLFFFSSRRRHTRSKRDWSSDVCSSDLAAAYDLTKAGHKVTIFEAADRVGGLAAGFRDDNWDWELEKYYHRSEERRVGKEGGSGWSADHLKKKQNELKEEWHRDQET